LAALSLQENTAAELAAAETALEEAENQQEALSVRLAAALAAEEDALSDLDAVRKALDEALAEASVSREEIEERLAAALLAKTALETELNATRAAGDRSEEERANLETRLAEALLAQESLQARVRALSENRTETEAERADLEARLAEALAAIAAAEVETLDQMTEAERQTALLATAQRELEDEKEISTRSQRQVTVLNQQVAALRTQVAELQSLLNLAEEADRDSQAQIEALGSQLNTALARVAAEERRRRELEEAERRRLEEERARLEAEAQNLAQYRSEFFGELRQVLAGQDRIRIEGDRFVFSSEVLFAPGKAELSEQGQAEISAVAEILRRISGSIPENIDWVIRVDGHTDNVPIRNNADFANNWELSQARALSVVLYMIEEEGISPRRLSANGFGEFQPLNAENSAEARAQNRRIELKLTER